MLAVALTMLAQVALGVLALFGANPELIAEARYWLLGFHLDSWFC